MTKNKLNRRQIKKRNKKYILDLLSRIPFKISRTAFGNGYFIFEMQPHSICWFWLEAFPDWKFGIWLGQDKEEKENAYQKFEIFGQTTALIDKFKPYASDLCETSITDFNMELYAIAKGEGRWEEYLKETEEEKARLAKVKAKNDIKYNAITAFIDKWNKDRHVLPEEQRDRQVYLELADKNSKRFKVSPRFGIHTLFHKTLLAEKNRQETFLLEFDAFQKLTDHLDKMWVEDEDEHSYDEDTYIFMPFSAELMARGEWDRRAKRYGWKIQHYGIRMQEIYDYHRQDYEISDAKLKIILAGWHKDNYWDNPSVTGMESTLERVYEGQYNVKYSRLLINKLYDKPELAEEWLKEKQ